MSVYMLTHIHIYSTCICIRICVYILKASHVDASREMKHNSTLPKHATTSNDTKLTNIILSERSNTI